MTSQRHARTRVRQPEGHGVFVGARRAAPLPYDDERKHPDVVEDEDGEDDDGEEERGIHLHLGGLLESERPKLVGALLGGSLRQHTVGEEVVGGVAAAVELGKK